MTVRLRLTALLAAVVVVAAACQHAETPAPAISGEIDKGNPTTTVSAALQISTDIPTPEPLSADRQARLDKALAAIPANCEILSDKDFADLDRAIEEEKASGSNAIKRKSRMR